MNRRSVFLTCAVFLPVGLFFMAREAASWKPVAVVKIANAQPSYVWIPAISERYLITRDGVPSDVLLDLKTKEQRPLKQEGITSDGAWKWKIELSKETQLILQSADDAPVRYAVPKAMQAFGKQPFHWIFKAVYVSDADNCVELLLDKSYYRWNKKTRQLERQIEFDIGDGTDYAMPRDKKTIVSAGYQAITSVSTRNGSVLRRLPFQGFHVFGWSEISPLGSYAFYPTFDNTQKKHQEILRMIDTTNGNVLWTLDGEDYEGFDGFFSSDEKWIAMPISYRNQWQIFEAATGKRVRTLPLIHNSINTRGAPKGAFSLDNSTIYSVADGVLYRQRAR